LCLAAGKLDAAVVTDDAGRRLEFASPPARVVSLLPSVTEIIRSLGVSDSLAGVTYDDAGFEGTAGVRLVGGAFTPQFGIIDDIAPDLLIVPLKDIARARDGRGRDGRKILAADDAASLAESENRVRMIGEIFDKSLEAERVIREQRELMETVRLKVEKIPEIRHKRAILLTRGEDGLATPGKSSLQTEMLEAAGGLTGDFGEEALAPVALEKLREFDPDFIYTTHAESESVRKFLSQDGWKDLRAVKNGNVRAFPRELVCRASTHAGYFIAWLSSEIYADEFADRANLVHPEGVLSERAISIDVPYVERARVVESRIMDFAHRTLLVDFARPQRVVSTVRGERGGVETVGNSYSPTPTWSVYHKLGFERSRDDLLNTLKLDGEKVDIMFTGADMNNISIKSASYEDMTATAIVTAGVEGNAIRTSKDVGAWYEPGTINIMVMTNHKLSEQAATRAIVTVTEAKTAALWDMDIRSVQTRLTNPATGTGTDTVIIVSGEGRTLHGSGGHTKMGELIADVVYRGVREALLKQNGKAPLRSVFERLAERGLYIRDLFGLSGDERLDFQSRVEALLLSPKYQGFVEAAFSLGDAHVMGHIQDISLFEAWALQVAEDVAGRSLPRVERLVARDDLPVVLERALDALATGLKYRDSPARAVSGDVSLLVIDSDSYVAQLAVSGLDLPDGLRARAFCFSDLEKNASAGEFIEGSRVIVVDVMDDNLSKYVADRGLLEGRTVFAVRGSQDDGALLKRGFVFDPEIADYFAHLDPINIRNMLKRAVNLALDEKVAYDPVAATPETGIFHPDMLDMPGARDGKSGIAVFENYDDYRKWYESREGYDPKRPWLGLMFFSTSLVEGQREAFEELIKKLEAGGFNLLPTFGTDLTEFESYFLDGRRARIDALLSFSLKFYLSLNDDLRRAIEDLDVPIFNAINMYSQTIDEWRASESGIPPLDVAWTTATPEISGVIEPTPLMGKIEERSEAGGVVYRYELIPGMTERLIPRIHNWISLRKKPNGEKKVAIMYYNNSQGKQNIGASYLNVFRSLEEIAGMMKKSGYGIPDMKLDEDEIKGLVLRGGRNVGSWAPGELDDLASSGQVAQLSVDEYKKWFAELPEDFRRRVTEQWGAPEEGRIMTRNGRIIIPMIRAGNVVFLPEPARGITDDPVKLYHDPTLYPHHQYIAAYLWLRHVWGADAMVHLGTHATYEWLPGKGVGLSLSCPPEVMTTDIPNIYPYIVDDVGEGLQAKRRGRAVVVDHLVPPLTEAEGYHEYLELGELCEEYERANSMASGTAETYLERIRALATRTGIDKDLGLNGIERASDVAEIARYLEYLDANLTPFGLHTFGRSPEGDSLEETTAAILKQNPGLEKKEVEDHLKNSGRLERENFLRALEGRYVPSAEGNDPVRNPDAVPTGRNFYGFSPSRLPTAAAWALGQDAARGIIEKHIEKNGKYPEKVAVVLWAVESLRNEGVNEATILSLIGVEPVWNASGQATGTRPIPASRLGRPRIDVMVDISGLYRDLFPDKVLFIDAAIRQAAAQDDIENFISANDRRIEHALVESGMSEEDAGRFSRARIFSEANGAYGNRVEELVSASGLWEKDASIAEVFRKHTGFAYGGDFWGAPAESALSENLRSADVAWHSVSSQYYGLMDNDDMFMYLGGLSLAIRDLSGTAPQTLIVDQRTLGSVKMESLQKFLGAEMRSRYLNPKWIEGMKAENYAGAREMSNYVEYLWGWQVTTPDSVDESSWRETYEVYVEDKYGLEIGEFMDKENPWAYQSLTGRMLETTRKGYWEAGDEIKRRLAVNYATSVINRGLACCDHTCNNPQFHQMVLNIISIPGLMSPELVAEFKLAVERAGRQSLEKMVADRLDLLQNLGETKPREAVESETAHSETEQSEAERFQNDGPAAQNEAQSVKGYKMEEVEDTPEKTSIASSGVEWFASIFVLALLALFFIGFRRGGQAR
jgi:cobaltochelatase CobN